MDGAAHDLCILFSLLTWNCPPPPPQLHFSGAAFLWQTPIPVPWHSGVLACTLRTLTYDRRWDCPFPGLSYFFLQNGRLARGPNHVHVTNLLHGRLFPPMPRTIVCTVQLWAASRQRRRSPPYQRQSLPHLRCSMVQPRFAVLEVQRVFGLGPWFRARDHLVPSLEPRVSAFPQQPHDSKASPSGTRWFNF